MNPTAPLRPDLAADYREAVYAALADLPGEEIADALEEVETNLVDVLAELAAEGKEITTPVLRARLGSPREYADEFRAAAGYPPALGRPATLHLTPNRLAVISLVLSAGLATAAGITVMADAESWIWGLLAALAALFAAAPARWLARQDPALDGVIIRRISFGGPSLRIRPRKPANQNEYANEYENEYDYEREKRNGKESEQDKEKGSQAALWEVRSGPTASLSRLPRPSRELRADFVDIARAWWLVVAVGLGIAVHETGGNPAAGLIVGLVAVIPCFRLGRVVRRDRRWLWLAVPLTAFTLGLGVGAIVDEARGNGYSDYNPPSYYDDSPGSYDAPMPPSYDPSYDPRNPTPGTPNGGDGPGANSPVPTSTPTGQPAPPPGQSALPSAAGSESGASGAPPSGAPPSGKDQESPSPPSASSPLSAPPTP